MKNLFFLFFVILFTNTNIYGQSNTICAIKIGSNYYINCKRIITFSDQTILTLTNSNDNSIEINFDIFSINGKKEATVKDGKLTEGNKELYTIKSSEKEYAFIEKSTNRIICLVKKHFDPTNKRFELHVWTDMYMPNGFYFQCTPETTNVPILNYIQGSTFSNSDSAITLN